jgi:Tol biopolymer transport system component
MRALLGLAVITRVASFVAAPPRLVPLLAIALASTGLAQSGSTVRVSVDSNGQAGNASSSWPSISADDRYVAFSSASTNLVAGDTNGFVDVFVRDRQNGTTRRVSLNSTGAQADNWCDTPAISRDGRFVVFASPASNLVPGDTNFRNDIFVVELATGAIERVSVSSLGAQANDDSYLPRISADGRYVAFTSYAQNLDPIDAYHGFPEDIFVRDRVTNTTRLVSTNSAGVQGNGFSEDCDISGDGRYVAFESAATNLAPLSTFQGQNVYRKDLITGATILINVDSNGLHLAGAAYPTLNFDGRFVAFGSGQPLVAGDNNQKFDLYVRDTLNGTTTIASVASNGALGNDHFQYYGRMSDDARYVSFMSFASDLVPLDNNGVPDFFVRDRLTSTTRRVTESSFGIQSDLDTYFGSLSADGRFVVYGSAGTNLAPGDANGQGYDVYLHDLGRAPTIVYCTAKTNSLGCVPAIGFAGSPSSSQGSGFLVIAHQLLNGRFGLLAYSVVGGNAVPFLGGTLCIRQGIRRVARQIASGGFPPPDTCAGTMSFDFAALIASGSDPSLVPAQHVWAQYWTRDNGFAVPDNASLTDAIEFAIEP